MNPLNGGTVNRIINFDAIKEMEKLPDDSITLTVTSPPYGEPHHFGNSVESNDHFIKLIDQATSTLQGLRGNAATGIAAA